MRGRGIKFFALIAAILAAGGCIFKPNRYQGVISYRDGRVYIKPDKYYDVGILPEGWQRMPTRARTISFYNPAFGSSISTDAFCARNPGDRRLESLGNEFLSALDNRKGLENVPFDLDGRGALRQKASGTLDGVPLVVDLVVVRKNDCVFDFFAVTPPGANPSVTDDFEAFFQGFHYE